MKPANEVLIALLRRAGENYKAARDAAIAACDLHNGPEGHNTKSLKAAKAAKKACDEAFAAWEFIRANAADVLKNG
jgi:hypothetical protein